MLYNEDVEWSYLLDENNRNEGMKVPLFSLSLKSFGRFDLRYVALSIRYYSSGANVVD
jgi:hypothetical protein